MVIQGIFPWCFTPELYAAKPEYIDSLADFVRSRPMPPVDAFLRQSEAVLAHDASGVLGRIQAPRQITFGQPTRRRRLGSPGPLTEAIKDRNSSSSRTAHTRRLRDVAEFNATTMSFLTRAPS